MSEMGRTELLKENEQLRRKVTSLEKRLKTLEKPRSTTSARSARAVAASPAGSREISVGEALSRAVRAMRFDGFLFALDADDNLVRLAGELPTPAVVIESKMTASQRSKRWFDWIGADDMEAWKRFRAGLSHAGAEAVIRVKNSRGETPYRVFCVPTADGQTWCSARPATPKSEVEADRWANVFAHEMNQPLATILTSAQACLRLVEADVAERDEVAGALQVLVRKATYAGDLVRRLRAWATQAPPRRQPTDLNAVLRAAVESLADAVSAAKIRVQWDLAPVLPRVSGDPVQLQQVAVNLIRNAVEAMLAAPPEARTLTLRARHEDGEVVATIDDQGPGLSVALIDRLFSPLASTKPDGMGLGLAISRRLVQLHEGRLWVKPNLPHGCSFRFSVPTEKATP